MKTYEQRRREEFEKAAAAEGYDLGRDYENGGYYVDGVTDTAWTAFCHAHQDVQTIDGYIGMFPTKAAAARALNVDNKQLNRWEHARAVLIDGVIYNRRKKDQ